MRIRLGIIILGVTLLLIGCTSPHRLPEAPTAIPRLAAATLPPSGAQPPASAATESPGGAGGGEEAVPGGDATRGQQVFASNCAVCHDLTNQPKVGPGLGSLFANQPTLPNGQPFSEENLREWIQNGGGAMPGIPLGEGEMDDLVALLRQETQ
jgi:mono/diheme cytochrome c family protein